MNRIKARSALVPCLLLLSLPPLTAFAAWWESPHDKWYFKDDWKGAVVNNFSKTIPLLGPATNGWIVIWGEQGVSLRVNGQQVMRRIDRGLIYDTNFTAFIAGTNEVKLQAGPGRIVAEGEIYDDQRRRYPFASGCDWKTPVDFGTKLEPSPKAYRPGEASGAFHSAHNGLLIRYNPEERGKADIAKALGRIQKLRDQSIFLLRRFRPAEDILNFSPEVLWRKAEAYANTRITQAEKLLTEQAIPAQKQENYDEAIGLAERSGRLLAEAELSVNSARELEEAERHVIHLENCAELIKTIHPQKADETTRAEPLAQCKKTVADARIAARLDKWNHVQKNAETLRTLLAQVEEPLAKLWGAPLGKLDEFPEDRFGWFNAQGMLVNDPANWDFTTVNPSANWIDLRGYWSFRTDPGNKGEELGWHKRALDATAHDGWQAMRVPREWERAGITDENANAPRDCPYKLGDLRCEDKPYNGYAWYRREVLIPKSWAGQKMVLHVEKVSNWLRVYLNGSPVGEPRRDGGDFAFPREVVLPGEMNTIAILVYNHDNFGGIVGGRVSLSVDGVQPEVMVTPGPLSWTYETTVHTTEGVEHTVAFATVMSSAVVLSSDQPRLRLWGWEPKGFLPRPPRLESKVRDLSGVGTWEEDSEFRIQGDTLKGNWIVLAWRAPRFQVWEKMPPDGRELPLPVLLAFDQRPTQINWHTNALGFRELTVQFSRGGWKTIMHPVDGEDISGPWHPQFCDDLVQYLRAVPVGCSELALLNKPDQQGQFYLKYKHMEIGDFLGRASKDFAPFPHLYRYAEIQRLFPAKIGFEPLTNTKPIYFGVHRLSPKLRDESYALPQTWLNFYHGVPQTNLVRYTTTLVDKSKLLKGIGELFAKRKPEFNARGGNTEQQMFDDWKAWGFDHCRYAFAWMADWDIPLQKRLGGPISEDPALWERMDYLVKQHTDRGIMAMLTYFFNEDSPQRDSKNLMRNSTRYWQMHPETRTNCYELWRRIAQRYADYPDGLIAYDFFNEPAYMHRDDWNQIIKDLTKIVRSVDKKHLIVCEAGDGWSQPQWFHWLEPTGDTNTIYSFHHYGKHWGYNYDEYYPGYKSMPEKKMDVLLEAILFGLQYNVPMHCGEFGVSMISSSDDHLVWLDDYLALFERFGIGWNWWNWDGNGIYRTGLKAGDEVSPNLKVLQKWIERKKAW